MRGFDPNAPGFFDRADLESEMDRIFDICHGCRLCWNLCPSFPFMFDTIDEGNLEHASQLDWSEKMRVVDLCYNCKLCDPKCPYTPPHRFELDFPALMLRAKAVKARHQGISSRDKFLGNPVLVAKIGGLNAGLTNAMNAPGTLARKAMGVALGIHPGRKLPPIAPEPFDRWFANRGPSVPRGEKRGTVALFHTCSVNYNWPEGGRALVEVLEHNGFEVFLPVQKCCGMPALDGGDLEVAKSWARDNLDALHAAVQDGFEIVVPGPSCSLMIKREYETLLGDARAGEVARNTYDACEFLLDLHHQGVLDTNFVWKPERIGYHLPCHLKVQNLGAPARELMALTGAQVDLVEKCSGMDGTWGMKKEFFEESMKQARKLSSRLQTNEPDVLASDCPLASLQVDEVTDVRPVHPVQVLHRAYGLDRTEESK